MHLFCLTPNDDVLRWVPAALMRALGPHAEITRVGEDLSEADRDEHLGRCDGCVVWLHAPLIGESKDSLAANAVALACLAAAKRVGIAGVALGVTVDRVLVNALQELNVRAYISALSPRTFELAVASAFTESEWGQERSCPQFYNMDVEVCLDVRRQAVKWASIGSYCDTLPHSGATAWAPIVIGDVRQQRAESPAWKDASRVGHYLGALLMPFPEGEEFFSLIEKTAHRSRVPVFVATESDWTLLPFELAVLPKSGLRLSSLHPIIRAVDGHGARAEWRPPLGKGLRVLLIASNVSGFLDGCPHGRMVCCQTLGALNHVDREVQQVQSAFLSAEAKSPGTVEKIHVVSSADATLDRIMSVLGEEWDIVHYAGHGLSCWQAGREEGCLVLKERGFLNRARPSAVSSSWLVSQLAIRSPKAMLYLSCCESMDSGLCYCAARTNPCEAVGFQSYVDDAAAGDMAVTFYQALLAMMEVGVAKVSAALLNARVSVSAKGRGHDLAAGLSAVCVGRAKA